MPDTLRGTEFFMNDQQKYNLTAKIADVEPFNLPISMDEERFYRHIIEQLNKIWTRLHIGAHETPRVALAKTALYFAEMYYRRTALLNEQSKMLESFEAELDRLLEDVSGTENMVGQ